MTTVLSMFLIFALLTLCTLYCYKLLLQCKVLSAKLPKQKTAKRKRKVVYADDLDD